MKLCTSSPSFSGKNLRNSKSLRDDRPFSYDSYRSYQSYGYPKQSEISAYGYPKHNLYDRVVLPCQWNRSLGLQPSVNKNGTKNGKGSYDPFSVNRNGTRSGKGSYDPFFLLDPLYSEPFVKDGSYVRVDSPAPLYDINEKNDIFEEEHSLRKYGEGFRKYGGSLSSGTSSYEFRPGMSMFAPG